MSWDVCTQTNPKARKEYDCDASGIFNAEYDDEDLDLEDRVIMAKAKEENWKILSGAKYVKVTGIWDGEAGTFRAREDMDKLCHKYHLYDECAR